MIQDGTMSKLRNENGIALITALMFTLVILGMIMALMQMLLAQTKMAGAEKSYRNSLDAAYGGTELLTKDILPRLAMSSYSTNRVASSFGGMLAGQIGLTINNSNPVNNQLQIKLTQNTANWASKGVTTMQTQTAAQKLDPKYLPDFQFQLKGNNNDATYYKVYAKIVDTVSGNSDMSGLALLDSGAGVTGSSSGGGGISPKHNPSLYTIEVQGERATNPKEKARLSVLYAY